MFPNSLPQVQKKWKNVQTENIKYFCDYFQKRNTVMDVYRAEVTFLILMGEMDLFIIILCCIVCYCVISVSKASNK